MGKSTLCTLFALYLAYKGKKVTVLDGDPQKSILKRRKKELEVKTFDVPFDVFDIDFAKVEIEDFMDSLADHGDAVLIDTPGTLETSWLLDVIVMSDAVVIPVDYEVSVMTSTMEMVMSLLKHVKETGAKDPKKIFVPNRFNKNWVKMLTEEQTQSVDENLKTMGVLTATIGQHAEIWRATSHRLGYRLSGQTSAAFEQMYNEIFE